MRHSSPHVQDANVSKMRRTAPLFVGTLMLGKITKLNASVRLYAVVVTLTTTDASLSLNFKPAGWLLSLVQTVNASSSQNLMNTVAETTLKQLLTQTWCKSHLCSTFPKCGRGSEKGCSQNPSDWENNYTI